MPTDQDTGAGTPLTAVEQAYFDGFKGGLDDEPSHWDDTNEEIAGYAREYARSRPATDPAGLDALHPWLRHKNWCNVKTDDPPDTERCKCGLAAAIRARLSVADGPGPALDVEKLAKVAVEPYSNGAPTGRCRVCGEDGVMVGVVSEPEVLAREYERA